MPAAHPHELLSGLLLVVNLAAVLVQLVLNLAVLAAGETAAVGRALGLSLLPNAVLFAVQLAGLRVGEVAGPVVGPDAGILAGNAVADRAVHGRVAGGGQGEAGRSQAASEQHHRLFHTGRWLKVNCASWIRPAYPAFNALA